MARKKKKKKEASGPPGAPEWVVTFTDMISLLVTFFVLLMTFSSLDAYDVLKVDSWLTGNLGIHDEKGFVLPELPEDDLISSTDVLRGSLYPHSRPAQELEESIEEMGQKMTAEHLPVDFDDMKDGLVIEFGTEACFEPGSTEVQPDLAKSLGEIGKVLENYPNLVVVEGFTDGAFLPTTTYDSAEALSVARAAAAARVLLEKSRMPRELLQISGFGDAVPRADDVSASGRRLNRRVRLRVLSLSKLRAVHLQLLQERARREDY